MKLNWIAITILALVVGFNLVRPLTDHFLHEDPKCETTTVAPTTVPPAPVIPPKTPPVKTQEDNCIRWKGYAKQYGSAYVTEAAQRQKFTPAQMTAVKKCLASNPQ